VLLGRLGKFNLQHLPHSVRVHSQFLTLNNKKLLQHSLLQCNAYYKEWNTKFGPAHGRQTDVMTQERRRWSMVSKSARGLYLLDADLKRGKSLLHVLHSM